MGLHGNSFEFPGKTPSVEEVAQAIRTFAISAAGEEERNLLKEAISCLRLSETTVSIRLAADRSQRRRREVFITVSLRGRDLVVRGNHARLFGVTCSAIEHLGGMKQWPGMKSN
jgi:hypothetical protein